MSDIRARLAEALRENGVGPAHAEILSDALLSLPGIAITQAPEHTTNSNGYDWKADGDTVFCDIFDDRKVSAVVLESDSGEAQLIYPQNPRALAVALLAAANASEQSP
jgi:sugar lactone lactonase YvrE